MAKPKFTRANPQTTASSLNTVQTNRISDKQKTIVTDETQDPNVFLPNTKLYPYNWFSLSRGGGIPQEQNSQTLTDFLQQVYQHEVLYDQLQFQSSNEGQNKDYVQFTIGFGLSYAQDVEGGQNPYIDAMLLTASDNFYWQQAGSFAEYLNPKEYDFYVIRNEDYSNINAMKFWTVNEDVLTLGLTRGQQIPNDKTIFVTDTIKKITINPNGTFQYVILGIKKVIPYLASESNTRVWTEFYPDIPFTTQIKKIRITYANHSFLLNRLFVFGDNNVVTPLDYEIITGDNLRHIDFAPNNVMNNLWWSSTSLQSLQSHWNQYQYAAKARDSLATVNIYGTTNGELNAGLLAVNEGISYPPLVDNMMISDSDFANQRDSSSGATVNRYIPTSEDYNGYANYIVLAYEGKAPGIVFDLDDGLAVSDMFAFAYAINFLISSGQKSALYNYYPANSEEYKDAVTTFMKNERLSWENMKQQYIQAKEQEATAAQGLGRLIDKVAVERLLKNILKGGYGNSNRGASKGNNSAIRPYQSQIPAWKSLWNSYYFLDIIPRVGINTSATLKQYLLLFSKPVKNDQTFANIQGTGNNYYWDSEAEKKNIQLYLIGRNPLLLSAGNNMFPTFFSSVPKFEADTSSSFARISSVITNFVCLTPNTPEELLPYWKPFTGPEQSKYRVNQYNLPVNQNVNTPVYKMIQNIAIANDNTFFTQNPLNKGQWQAEFSFVDGFINNFSKTLGSLSGLLIADYGGGTRRIEIIDETDTVVYDSGEVLATAGTNPLKATKLFIFGSSLAQGVSTVVPYINNSFTFDITKTSATEEFTFTNDVPYPINIIQVVATNNSTGQAHAGVVTTVSENFDYKAQWDDVLESDSVYTVTVNWNYNTGNETISEITTITSFQTDYNRLTIDEVILNELTTNTIDTTATITLNGTTITGHNIVAISGTDTVQPTNISLDNGTQYSVDWVEVLDSDTEYILSYTLTYKDKITTDSTTKELNFRTLSTDNPDQLILLKSDVAYLDSDVLVNASGSCNAVANVNPSLVSSPGGQENYEDPYLILTNNNTKITWNQAAIDAIASFANDFTTYNYELVIQRYFFVDMAGVNIDNSGSIAWTGSVPNNTNGKAETWSRSYAFATGESGVTFQWNFNNNYFFTDPNVVNVGDIWEEQLQTAVDQFNCATPNDAFCEATIPSVPDGNTSYNIFIRRTLKPT